MQVQPTWLTMRCAQMAADLKDRLSQDEISGFSAKYARFALLYYVSPFDLLPDFLPGIGYLDDFMVVSIARLICGSGERSVSKDEIAALEDEIRDWLKGASSQDI